MAELDPQLITKRTSTINCSTAKFMYSFGKEKRFKDFKMSNDKMFYDLPPLRSTRMAGFGFGTKSDFTSGTKGKCQNIYELPSQFDVSRKTGKVYSMGRGRDECKLGRSATGNTPGPGAYHPYKALGEDAKKYSMYGRGWKPLKIKTEPGPGQYKLMCINTEGKYSSSLFTNSPCTNFYYSKSNRFKYLNNKNPSPDAYFHNERLNLMNGTGYLFSSKYKNNVAKTFGNKSYTKDFYIRQGFPGPGTYEVFSDFNGFTKEKRQKMFNSTLKKKKSQNSSKINYSKKRSRSLMNMEKEDDEL